MQQSSELKRGLKARHLTMMALGGTIGTGLFLASGNVIHTAGPGGALMGYIIVAILVYCVMICLGEMAAFSPITGSFCAYSAKYVDKAFGFAMSWNYWLNWALVVASEIIAGGLVMQFWFPHASVWVWSSFFFFLILALNFIGVKIYGETEYWLSFIKIATVVIFIVIGALTIFGIVGHQGPVGFKNIVIGDAPFHGGWLGFFTAFFAIGYTFQGTELVGVAVGETEQPKKSIASAVKRIFWRITLFYVLTILVISFLIPYTNSLLVNANSTVSESPFTLIFDSAGLKYVASFMNFVILSAIISTANASLYTASRVLWHIGNSKEGPAFLNKVYANRVPIAAALISAFFAAVFIFSSALGSGRIFQWLLNVISLAGYVAWFGICWSHYRFRRAYILQGNSLDKLTYRVTFFPFVPLFGMILIVLIAIGQEAVLILTEQETYLQFFSTYIGLIIFIGLYIAYKIKYKTKLVSLKKIPL